MLEEFLSKIGVPVEKLEEEEKRTLMQWLENLSQQRISLNDVENYIRKMADDVARELCEAEVSGKKDIFLKARLKNYLLLLDFLTAPRKARESLEKYLKGLKL